MTKGNIKMLLSKFTKDLHVSFYFFEGVYTTIGNPAFCLFLYLTGVHFRDELQYGGDVSQQKVKCRPIRTREIAGVSLSDVLCFICLWLLE